MIVYADVGWYTNILWHTFQSSGSKHHQPVQWLQNFQFYFLQDCESSQHQDATLSSMLSSSGSSHLNLSVIQWQIWEENHCNCLVKLKHSHKLETFLGKRVGLNDWIDFLLLDMTVFCCWLCTLLLNMSLHWEQRTKNFLLVAMLNQPLSTWS